MHTWLGLVRLDSNTTNNSKSDESLSQHIYWPLLGSIVDFAVVLCLR